jgi:hypothetical protein
MTAAGRLPTLMGEEKAFLASAANLSTSNSLCGICYTTRYTASLQDSRVGRLGPSERDSFLALGYDRLSHPSLLAQRRTARTSNPSPALEEIPRPAAKPLDDAMHDSRGPGCNVEKVSRSAIRLQVSPGHSGVSHRTVGVGGDVVGLSWRASGHALVPGLSYLGEWSFPTACEHASQGKRASW